jgi:hypothetical protein
MIGKITIYKIMLGIHGLDKLDGLQDANNANLSEDLVFASPSNHSSSSPSLDRILSQTEDPHVKPFAPISSSPIVDAPSEKTSSLPNPENLPPTIHTASFDAAKKALTDLLPSFIPSSMKTRSQTTLLDEENKPDEEERDVQLDPTTYPGKNMY